MLGTVQNLWLLWGGGGFDPDGRSKTSTKKLGNLPLSAHFPNFELLPRIGFDYTHFAMESVQDPFPLIFGYFLFKHFVHLIYIII